MRTPKSFKCKRCGSCCRISPFLTDKDIKKIEKSGYSEDYFVEDLKEKKFMKMINDRCIFLNDRYAATSCRIYMLRPDTCRQYPTEIRENGDCTPEILKFDKKLHLK